MANKAFSYYKELPAWAKGVVVVGGLAVTYIFVSQIISRIKKQASDKENRQAVESAKDDLQDLSKRGVKPTLTKAQTDSMADAILNQYKKIELHARKIAIDFYQKQNFQQIGEVFYEVGIPHLKMVKILDEVEKLSFL
jgi:predicted GNAT family N-acyltransferase